MKGYYLKVIASTLQEIDDTAEELKTSGGWEFGRNYNEEEDTYTGEFYLNANTKFTV